MDERATHCGEIFIFGTVAVSRGGQDFADSILGLDLQPGNARSRERALTRNKWPGWTIQRF